MTEEDESLSYESAKELLTSYLNKRMRITISDGRVIDGNFLCTDKDCNIVLSNCEEFLSREEVDEYETKSPGNQSTARQPRTLSLAIVPGEHVCSICLAKDRELSTEMSFNKEIKENNPDGSKLTETLEGGQCRQDVGQTDSNCV